MARKGTVRSKFDYQETIEAFFSEEPGDLIESKRLKLLNSVRLSHLGEQIIFHSSEDAILLQKFFENTKSEHFFNPIWLQSTYEYFLHWLYRTDLSLQDPFLFNALLFEFHNYYQAAVIVRRESARINNPKKRTSLAIKQIRSLEREVARAREVILAVGGHHWPIDSDAVSDTADGLKEFSEYLQKRMKSLKSNSPICFSFGRFQQVKTHRYIDGLQTRLLFNVNECFFRLGGCTRERAMDFAIGLLSYDQLPEKIRIAPEAAKMRILRANKGQTLSRDWKTSYGVLMKTVPHAFHSLESVRRLKSYLKNTG